MIYLRYDPATNLGNYMFQIAFALSLRRNEPIGFYVTSDAGCARLDRYKELYPRVEYALTLPLGIREFDDARWTGEMPSFRGGEDIYIRGFVLHPGIFDVQAVREYFKCPSRVENRIRERYQSLFDGRTLVGVSVRRGDYLKLSHRHPFVGRRYLQEAVERFSPSVTYVVCSDDLPWCKRFFARKRFAGRNFTFVENEDVLTQLFVHTKCHHNIISNSTFSWWGAFLNPHADKRVIFPSMWYGFAIKDSGQELYWRGAEVVQNRYEPDILLRAITKDVRCRIGAMLRKMGILK